MTKTALYTKMENWPGMYPAVVIKCDICEEMFQVRKGFVLKEDVIACFKHISEETLEVVQK